MQLTELCAAFLNSPGGLPAGLFLMGLAGSAVHCAPMCGPFVLAQTGDIQRLSGLLLLPYHLGRITTYAALAALTAQIVNLAFVGSELKMLIAAPMLALAGILFIVAAFPKLSYMFPWAARITLPVPASWLARGQAALARIPPFIRPYALGVLLGFMPCGLVLSALLFAGARGEALQAALGMAAFGLGTMPALIAVALGGRTLKHFFPVFMRGAVPGLLLLNGAALFILAGFLWQ
jgi:sulfite exporter TauE/SafE